MLIFAFFSLDFCSFPIPDLTKLRSLEERILWLQKIITVLGIKIWQPLTDYNSTFSLFWFNVTHVVQR